MLNNNCVNETYMYYVIDFSSAYISNNINIFKNTIFTTYII